MSDQEPIRVRDVMKTDFDTVDGRDTIAEALSGMRFVETKVLIVNKRHENDEFGIVQLEDIATDVLARDRSPNRVNIYEIMEKPLIGIDPDMDIRYCARLFERQSLHRAAVVEHRAVIGVISYADIVLKGMLRLLE